MELSRLVGTFPVAVVPAFLLLSACGNGASPPAPSSPAASAVGAAPSASATAAAFGPSLKPGDTAPNFELMGSDGKKHSLAEHLGHQAVIVAWFPKAFTSG